ncbi:MAG: 3-dehydroquinate synthase [Lachnospiraceae bacterium]|nr:3-dehydroquinate synthase [Lachnospiraceae bacterium]
MKEELMVCGADGAPLYPIKIEESFDGIVPLIAQLQMTGRKICIVSDSNVTHLYEKEVRGLLEKEGFFCVSFSFPAGEASKNLDTVSALYEFLIENSFDRNDVLIALGGGVTGDLTGFAAATYLRGIRFIGMPTSLLSMVDSSIGGKTGVDYKSYKNMVGAFYQPSAVYINVSALNTLSEREFLAGMGEVVKHGFILDKEYYRFLKEKEREISARKSDVLCEMIFQSLCIKRGVVERDPKEKGERALLNFGHTIGHAVEKLNHFEFLHGECVSVGMVAAAELSVMHGLLSRQEVDEVKALLDAFGMKTKVPMLDKEELLSVCHRDKKADGAKINFVLLRTIGEAFICSNVSDDEIWNAFKTITE